MGDSLILSTLPKTWVFDLDGTLLKHNGYKIDGHDSLLPGVKEYLDRLPHDDFIIFLTARDEEYRKDIVEFLSEHAVRYDHIVFGLPYGERIVVNDRKPSGIDMSIAINLDRNVFSMPEIKNVL
ncbi:MAG: NIF family HAD-type phosphatase [Selenomonadaceae bacterium]|nr:NIF family HAD-type phosphatase [Selenomonadaceae bacterium]